MPEMTRYEHGVPSWADIGTQNLDAGVRFYSELFGAARRLGIPVVLYTHQNVPRDQGWWDAWKQRRMLRKLTGLVAGSDLAGTLVRQDAPNLPIAGNP